jgi:hypothetical protein
MYQHNRMHSLKIVSLLLAKQLCGICSYFFNSLETRTAYGERILGIRYISLLFKTLFRNIFRSNKYFANYD